MVSSVNERTPILSAQQNLDLYAELLPARPIFGANEIEQLAFIG